MPARSARRLCAASLAVLTLAASAAQAQMPPEAIAQGEALGLCDPTLPPGARMPGRMIGCTPQQAAALGIPPGSASGMSGGGGMAGAGGGGILAGGGGDPLNMGGPFPGPKAPGAPKSPGGPTGPGGGPLAGGPRFPGIPAGTPSQRGPQLSGMSEAQADQIYNQMEADVLEAMQADNDSAEARAADRKMRAEAAKLRAQRDAAKTKKREEQLAEYKHCRLIAPVKYDRVMGEIAAEHAREMAGAEAGVVSRLKKKREDQERHAAYWRDHECDELNPDYVEVELAPLPVTPAKK